MGHDPVHALTLAEVKAHLRIEQDDETEDTLLSALIQAAREYVERTGHFLVSRQWTMTLDEFPAGPVEIRRTPVREVLSVTYDGYTEIEEFQTSLSSSDESRVSFAMGGAWPDTDGSMGGIVVTFTAGYESPADVPQLLKQGMLLYIGDLYEHREDTVVGNIVNPRGAAKAIFDLYAMGWWLV
jgi:uncharacterized phiE125 gp8 family phage protein